MRLAQRWLILVVALGSLFASGCLTAGKVERIVAESNAAMVAPYVDRLDGAQPGGWANAVEELDQLIERYSDQDTLANHLRVRQAILLTVNKRDDLAEDRWSTVERGALTTERDKALFDARKALVWAYKSLPGQSTVDAAVAAPHLATLGAVLEDVEAVDLKVLLETIRAEIQLKVANGMDEDTEAEAINERLADALMTFVDAFPDADVDWVKRNIGAHDPPEMSSISDFRRRVWLKELIKAYGSEAKNMNLKPTWQPDWVANLLS